MRICTDAGPYLASGAPLMNILQQAAWLLLLASVSLSAGSTNLLWRWSNPLPFGANIADLASRSNHPVVAVAEYGQLFDSWDLTTWTRRETGTSKWLRSATFFGNTQTNTARLLVACGEAGTILVSEDFESFNQIPLNTTDWLEGIAASTTRLVAVGDNAAIYTSDDGTNWVRQTPNLGGVWLRSVTWRSSGLFVAVGESGLIATSPNGTTWTRRNSPTTAHLNRVVATPTGFCAVGEGGVVVVDPNGNGVTWRSVNSGASGDLYAAMLEVRSDLPGQPTGALIVAGDEEVRSGVLAVNLWIDETDTRRSSPAPKATYLAGFWDTDAAVLAGRAGLVLTGIRPTTTSSFQWSLPDSPPRSWLFAMATNQAIATNTTSELVNGIPILRSAPGTNTIIVAVGDGPTILQSDDGISWSTSLIPTNAAGAVYLGAAAAANTLIAVGSGGLISFSQSGIEPLITTNSYTNGAQVIPIVFTNEINTLGLVWSPAITGITNNLQGIAASPTRWIASGSAGVLLTSTDVTNWTRLSSPVSTFLSSVEFNGSLWVATGEGGEIISSSDGSSWNRESSPSTAWIWRTRWLNNQFVGVGHNGAILTSPDGHVWSVRSSGVTNNLNDVVWAAGTYYVAGNQGTILGSSDSIHWSSLPTITTKALLGLSHINGRLLACGADGAILRTIVTPLPSLPTLVQWPQLPTNRLFLVTGELDQLVHLDFSTNLLDWTSSPRLEITDPATGLFYLNQTPNDPANQFFRVRQSVP